jgi:putative SOS response-associated peptidase YedK
MCGRYASARSADDLVAEFDTLAYDPETEGPPPPDKSGAPATPVPGPDDEPMRPDYNIAPTTRRPIVRISRSRGGRVVEPLKWGLVPSWAKDQAIGSKLFNARAETLATKPAFRSAFSRRRCLVPADGWYEWSKIEAAAGKGVKPAKQAWYVTPADGSVLAFGGLWEIWGQGDDRLATFTIVTTDAVGPLTGIHSRMPLALPRDRWPAWLGEDEAEESALLLPSEELIAGLELRPVGPAVGNVRNNDPHLRDLVKPEWETPVPQTLF